MKKEVFYLKHDYNSRNDEKVLRLRVKYPNGTGYAIYWMVLEKLAESSEGRLRLDDIDVIAYELQMDSEWITDVIRSYGLFELDNSFFWSNRLLADMNERNEKSQKAVLANKIRWDNVRKEANKNPNGVQPDIQMESKERRGEERKEKRNIKEKFKIPEVKEIQEYLEEIKCSSISAQDFSDYYQAQGWVLANGRSMKDWKAAVRTWRKRKKRQDNFSGIRQL